MELIKTVRVIGSFMLALLLIAIPFLCGLSVAYNWMSTTKFLLIVLTVGLMLSVAMLIYAESED